MKPVIVAPELKGGKRYQDHEALARSFHSVLVGQSFDLFDEESVVIQAEKVASIPGHNPLVCGRCPLQRPLQYLDHIIQSM
jgi:hypothetical protein